MNEGQLCSRCVLSSAFPGVLLRDGLCNFCRDWPSAEALKERRERLAESMRVAIENARGSAEYDCVVAFSGGKDSSYTLMMLVREFGLNCLAVMVDNGFISDQAIDNGKTVTSALGVDLVTYTPSFGFMKKMYVESLRNDAVHPKSAIRRASSICNSCIGLINSYMMRTAASHGIPLIAGGYIGGQVPKDAAVLRVDLETQRTQRQAITERTIAAFGPAARRHLGLGPPRPDGLAELVIINPMLTVVMSEEEIVSALGEIGWKRTADTGLNSSNCTLNDLGISVHHRRHRFHPYVFEISEQIRAGVMTREAGLRRIGNVPPPSAASAQLRKLELDPATLALPSDGEQH